MIGLTISAYLNLSVDMTLSVDLTLSVILLPQVCSKSNQLKLKNSWYENENENEKHLACGYVKSRGLVYN